jgi:hypothetical protein
MIDTDLYVMLLLRAASITWASGRVLGPGNLDFFGPQMTLAFQLDAIWQGPKKSWFPGSNPLPHALVMDAASIKSIMHGAVLNTVAEIANRTPCVFSRL